MRVLVTGSHGFIGSQLVKALKERGDDVFESDLKIGTGIFADPKEMLELNGLWDEIYHLACINQEEAVEEPIQSIVTNAHLAREMALMAKRKGARLVYTSTASVYGNQDQQPIGSGRRPAPKSDYAVAKLAGEHFVRLFKPDAAIIRLSNVYGPGQTTENPYCGVVAKFFESALHGQPLKIYGNGTQTRDFTYVDDVVGHLMDNSLTGTLNCSYGAETDINTLARKICNLIGRYTGVDRSDPRPVDGIDRRVLRSDLICGTSLDCGLRKTLQWLQDEEIPVSAGFGRS